jgi:hypothetical protein
VIREGKCAVRANRWLEVSGSLPGTQRMTIMQNVEVRKTGTLQLALAWSIAGIPLLAGVAQTLVNAMKLFH